MTKTLAVVSLSALLLARQVGVVADARDEPTEGRAVRWEKLTVLLAQAGLPSARGDLAASEALGCPEPTEPEAYLRVVAGRDWARKREGGATCA